MADVTLQLRQLTTITAKRHSFRPIHLSGTPVSYAKNTGRLLSVTFTEDWPIPVISHQLPRPEVCGVY